MVVLDYALTTFVTLMVVGVRPAREAQQATQAAEEHARKIAAKTRQTKKTSSPRPIPSEAESL
jgi:hypothetical protein